MTETKCEAVLGPRRSLAGAIIASFTSSSCVYKQTIRLHGKNKTNKILFLPFFYVFGKKKMLNTDLRATSVAALSAVNNQGGVW